MADAHQRFPRLANPAYMKVDVDKLRFDPENPRFGGTAKRKNSDQIQEYLEGSPHYALNLVGSIVENGFLPYEPLIVRQVDEDFVVIEGNRRLAAVRAIRREPTDKYSASTKDALREIPVLIFPGSANHGDSEEMLRYLGVRHLFGFRDWPPASKAMFLDKRIGSKRDLAQVLKELNITRQEVARYLIPYRLTRSAKQVFKKVDNEDFWSLAESFGRRNIKAYIELDVDRKIMKIKWFNRTKLRYLTQFLYGKNRRVTDTRQLSLLSRILGSPRGARSLERGATLDEASLYAASKQETLHLLLKQLIRILNRIRKLSPDRQDSAKFLDVTEEFKRRIKK